MEFKTLSVLILAAIAVAVQADLASETEIEVQPTIPVQPSSEAVAAPKWDGIGLSADVNHYVDSTIHMLVPAMRQFGLDPMPLPDVVQGFQVRPLLITYSAWLRITSGSLSGLTNIAREEDQMVYYFAKMLKINLRFKFIDTEFKYNYLVQVMNIGPTGGILATLNRFVIDVDLLFDFNNDEIQLQEFRMSEIGRLRIRFTGNILTDWLINPVANVFLMIFDDVIIHVVVATIRNFVQFLIVILNQELKNIIRAIEGISV